MRDKTLDELDQLRRKQIAINGEVVAVEKQNVEKIVRFKAQAESELKKLKNENAEAYLNLQIYNIKQAERAELKAINRLNNLRQENAEDWNEILTLRNSRTDEHLKEQIESSFLEMQTTHERNLQTILQNEILNSNERLKNQQLTLKRQERIDQAKINRQEKIDSLLLDLNLNQGDTVAKMLAEDLNKTSSFVTGYIEHAGLFVGAAIKDMFSGKGGLFGNLFNSVARFTDDYGNLRTRLKGKEFREQFNAANDDQTITTDREKARDLAKSKIDDVANNKIKQINDDVNLSQEEKQAKINDIKMQAAQDKDNEDKKFEKGSNTNFIKDYLKSIKNNEDGAQDKFKAYLEAKSNLEKEDNEQNRKALEDAIAATGLSENTLKQAEAAETQKETTSAGWANATAILANIAQKLDGLTEEIALQQSAVDTRLAGSIQNDKLLGSYWRQINFDFSATMLSPLLDQKTLMSNLLTTVDKGIARDAEQFAMLETIKDKIATTFNVYDSTVLRLIRLQDENTSAVRMGMEVTLNKMLNSMYESTEYLSDIASNVRGSLVEAEALMDAQSAVEFEYQVQKWLGSMYSVGVSDQGVNALAGAIGQLASGQIEGITNGGASNLLIMAANNGNMSLSDILANGLDSSKTNVLLNNVVSYMYELVQEANGNKVVQQQLAKVFGMSASDLKAITNIIREDKYENVSQKSLYSYGNNGGDIYNGLLSNLFDMANSMYSRMSIGEMIKNVWSNVQYSTAAGMASNPVLFIANKVADILDTFAGGIPIPAIHVLGSGVDTHLTVSNIMKTASMVGGFTQSLISMIASSISNGGNGFTGSGLLNLVGVDAKVKRGASTSESSQGTVMNASVDDMTDSATNEGKDNANKEKVSAQEENEEITNKTMNESILAIKALLDSLVDNGAMKVSITGQPIQTLATGDTSLTPTPSGL